MSPTSSATTSSRWREPLRSNWGPPTSDLRPQNPSPPNAGPWDGPPRRRSPGFCRWLNRTLMPIPSGNGGRRPMWCSAGTAPWSCSPPGWPGRSWFSICPSGGGSPPWEWPGCCTPASRGWPGAFGSWPRLLNSTSSRLGNLPPGISGESRPSISAFGSGGISPPRPFKLRVPPPSCGVLPSYGWVAC